MSEQPPAGPPGAAGEGTAQGRSGGAAAAPAARPRATGTGPWPGEDPLEAARTVLGELGGDAGLPFLPELPARGPGSDAAGRTAALLVDLPVDLQPVGWRLVDHPGRDAERAGSHRRADLDALAEAADGWTGPLKLQVLGPWSLASSVWLPRGERAVVDAGARRDLVHSLGEGVAAHLRDVARLVPGADLVLQVDEPALPAVLDGRLPTASGWGRLPAVDSLEVREGLRAVLDAAGAAGASARGVRCPAGAPLGLVREAGASAIGVEVAALGAAGWESLAASTEAGLAPWLGALDPAGELPAVGALVEAVRRPWREVGLDPELLAGVVLAPTAGLAGTAPSRARAVLARLREGADALAEVAAGG
ncbi:hypothetical protein [Quadrisphaera sp. DSM 44207]|uniref:hypothetical protein n=1 Tax=Quadrisphaera sp. DSM 44207 TaxID=1881057 RepID=UPI00088ECED0|nr:hypothetical protein [Quadrisphaera sp. DSM 44207]SDQ74271.1 hypothetical protein SAMN05428996_2629 [Quadrisphaera sp. DSM 44207]